MSSLGAPSFDDMRQDGYGKEDGPPSKRRRVALACNACRTRKSRCNGERPKCSLCKNLGFDCQYEPAESSTNVIVRKEYVSDFETRLKGVEDMLKRHDDLLTGHLAACSAPQPQPEQQQRKPSRRKASAPVAVESDIKAPPLKKDDSIKLKSSDLTDLPAEELLTDGMAMAFADENDCAYFGPSSNIDFERHILKSMVAHNITNPKTFSVSHGGRALLSSGMVNYSRPPSEPSTPPPGRNSSLPGLNASGGTRGSLPGGITAGGVGGQRGSMHSRNGSIPSRHGSMPSAFELPPAEEMEELMKTYFEHTGLLFPFIHEPSFMETYAEFKNSNFSKVRRTWLGLLFVMLAMASVVDPGNKEAAPARFEKSRLLNERGAHLCRFASVRGSSLEIVQYLLLASQFLQSTQKSSQTWMLHGLAVKGAYAIGLHSNQASQRYAPLENEVRNRTWYGCILLDRILSMTFGRPPLIPEDYIRVPIAKPWPDGPRPADPNDDFQAPSMDFWNSSISIHRLIGRTISNLYENNLGWEDDAQEYDVVNQTLLLQGELKNWLMELSPELSIVTSTSMSAPESFRERIILRFRVILTLRMHHLDIMIHRPVLSRCLDVLSATPGGEPSSQEISQSSRNLNDVCLSAAEETINIVHTILTDPSLGAHALGAWWFTLFYIFNAALVVFSYSHIQHTTMDYLDHAPSDRDLRHLSRAIDALTLLDNENRIVNRCIEYVQYLSKILDRWNSRHSSGSSEQQLALAQQDSGLGVPAQPPQKTESRNPSASEGPLMPSLFSYNGGPDHELPDMNDYLKDDLELAQFFASGIFDMQNTGNDGI